MDFEFGGVIATATGFAFFAFVLGAWWDAGLVVDGACPKSACEGFGPGRRGELRVSIAEDFIIELSERLGVDIVLATKSGVNL